MLCLLSIARIGPNPTEWEDRAPEREPGTIALDAIFCLTGDGGRCVAELSALSFMVRLENSFGAMLYTGYGDIEFFEVLDDTDQPRPLPPPHPLDKAERNREAVVHALKALVEGRSPER